MTTATAADLIYSNDVRISAVEDSPATYDATGFGALTYDLIGNVVSVGEFGPQSEVGSTKLLGAAALAKSIGVIDYGEMSITVAKAEDNADDGQKLLNAAAKAASKTTHSFKVEFLGTGTATNLIYFFTAKVASFRLSIGTSPDAVTATVNVVLEREFVEVDPTNT